MTTIRKADPGDAPALVELGTEVGNEPEGWLITANGWRSAGDERRYLRALRRYPHAAVYVAEDEGRIVGRLSIARDQHPASYHVADLGLMVAATHRRRGIGRALLDAAVEWARESGVQKLELHVFPHNDAAHGAPSHEGAASGTGGEHSAPAAAPGAAPAAPGAAAPAGGH